MSMGGKEDGGAGKAARAAGKRADAAAEKMTGYGDEAISFTKKFYNDYIVPQLNVVKAEQAKGIARADTVFGQQQAQFQDREGTYQQVGKPAVENYFNMVQNYDPEAEAQRQGISQQGDIIAAGQNALQQTGRGLAARGIKPTAGVMQKAQRENNLSVGLARAQAMNRLRNLTNTTKLEMTGAAGQFGAQLGGQAAQMPGQSLQAGVIGSDIAGSAANTIGRGTGIPMSGLEYAGNVQSNIYGAEKGAQTSLQNTSAQLKSQDGGIGGLLGTVVGGIGGFMLGGPAGALKGASIGSSVLK